jgi:magnesium-transporting ATPase (P-type)
MNNKSKDDKLQFSGSSQDEITFLEMCRDVGFCSFIERDSNMITINVQGEEEKYQILRAIDFTSDRKKMTVIVKRESDGKVVSYIKGADGFINLNEESNAESTFVKEKLNDYASMGLRTLMFCKKDLGSENDEASVRSMEASELENDAMMLGITALEDLLQDNVKKCISDFREAQIKVWMLTGDKGETAQSIGILCGLIDPELHIIEKIDAITKEEIMQRLS